MKTLFLSLILFVTVSINAQEKWTLDASHSSINFAVSHLIISETTGSFDAFDITAITETDFTNPTFEVTIKTTSINTKNERRDNHLRADDFFGAEKHPDITFKSTSFKKTGDKTFSVEGNLSIKGITKKASFEGKLNGIAKTDYGTKAGLKLTTVIKRAEFGVGESGGSIGDNVEVTIHLEMNKQ